MTAANVPEKVYETEIVVKNPKLLVAEWLGRAVVASVSDDQSISKTTRLCTLTISQKADAWGNECAFIENGVKIFARGGNYIPKNAVYQRIRKEKIDNLLKNCVRAYFNCIRI